MGSCDEDSEVARAVMRGGKGGTCGSGVHSDATCVVTRAWQSGVCSGEGRCEVAARGTGEGHTRWCMCSYKGHRKLASA
jgi:hypothetical protein